MPRRNGSYFGLTVNPTPSVASGIWRVREAEEFLRVNKWPATPGVPGSPVGSAGNAQVSLTWSAPTLGTPPTDYHVQYSSNSGSTWTTFADGISTATSAVVTGLTNGTGYIFRVRAVNALGEGPYGAASGVVTPAANPVPETAGLAFWLDASDSSTVLDAVSGGDPVAADGAVAAWIDKSGNGWNATQAQGSRQPIRKVASLNGNDALEFDGADDWMQIAQNAIGNTGNMSVFVVAKLASVGNTIRLVLSKGDGATFAGTVWEMNSNVPAFGYANNDWFYTPGASLPQQQTVLLAARAEGGIAQFMVDGVDSGSPSSDPSGTNSISQFIGIMGSGASGSLNQDGLVGEIALYDAAISSSDMAAVSSYLMAKWGISPP